MMRFTHLLAALLAMLLLNAPARAQSVTVEKFASQKLGGERTIRISLPVSYAASPERRYPLIVTFDGEYMFYAALAASSILGAYEVAPEAIIVGIDQNSVQGDGGQRWTDCAYDEKSGALKGRGPAFKSFLEDELLPAIEQRFRTTSFRTIAGHSFTGTCVNLLLLDPEPRFSAFVAISPYLPASLHPLVAEKLRRAQSPTFYFASTGDKDLGGHIKPLLELDPKLKAIANPELIYAFRNYEGATHRSLVNRSFEDALQMVFSLSGPPRGEERSSPDYLADPPTYLARRYARASAIYGVKREISEDDLSAAAQAVIEVKAWAGLKAVGLHTRKAFPKSWVGDRALAQYYENNGEIAEAIKAQQAGCAKVAGTPGHARCMKLIDELSAKLKAASRSGAGGEVR